MKKLNTLQALGVSALLLAAAGFFAACPDPFKPQLQGIRIDRDTLYIEKGHSATLKAIGIPSTAEVKTVQWVSSNTSIVDVISGTSECELTTYGTGSVIITAKGEEGDPVTCDVTVIEIIIIALTNEKFSIDITPNVHGNVVWSSSNPGAAAVHKTDGTIMVKGAGSTVISAEVTIGLDKFTVTKTVQVNPDASSVTINPTSLSLTVGGTAGSLTATTVPTGATVTWISSNNTIATVSNGIVTAVAAGTANITATITVNGTTYTSNTCAVTV
ncbi:MAG: Ig-like domain-containing protein, partial [Treponema sp.]|nr:Ig-like domain-containing protein [Treponema sp.]